MATTTSKKQVNSNCYIQLSILEANFLRDDGDTFGKQDPFAQFTHHGQKYRTKTHEDGGRHADFGEVFKLGSID